ncbi:MAG: 16S rRNA (uracil(1498)-N(3))-methyltransferase [Spirochaetaceae bacterium]|nr:MAG: 16S rRNA (uracil(1498)-N(3))-methyltransferase [Spirochaetaceae bacterium]
MRTFVLPPQCAAAGRQTLDGRSYHYLCRVRRCSVGDAFDATDGRGTPYRCTVVELRRNSCVVQVSHAPRNPVHVLPASTRITLYQALAKGRKLEQIIRQTTEAGVACIVPFSSRFCVAEVVQGQRLRSRLARWRTIAREAVQQSGRLEVPEITEPVSLEQIAAVDGTTELGLLFVQQPLAQHSLHEYLRPNPSRVAIVIGAEGGFSGDEVDYLCGQRGYQPVCLGPTVLRTETAALYALAAVQTILMEIEAWSGN